VLGLDFAGKTSMLCRLQGPDPEISARSADFVSETITCEGLTLRSWDVGGHRLRHVWRAELECAHGLIFVVDSNDSSRFAEAREELGRLLDDDHLREPALLVWGNKQDLRDALVPDDLARLLGLKRLVGRPWRVQRTCSLTGDGLLDGLEWLGEELSKRS
jgi:signal recognition particle receptor subunit beta